ncbi:MAG: flagellar protein FliT [Hydrogenophaga sp.]|jgi:flagellar protein FliT|uniref:flagellar protein FliT n=1 Tax=Hydrogenophaga sp. TaxID=1904254 RepID=UPI0025BFA368|nr:flagellar protein FliT [Hydrogenophaga sp.]MDO9506570.1 flagellar protein FliT [Hydrogenophaga sp.]MDP3205176.1 flagellar protein FliT [Hydrogenophaga sp.]MDP3626690.1 flagellar protein FliT [Hydrogenophaga sp.]
MEHSLLDYYKAIERTSSQMLDAAKTENWDQVVRLEGACAVLIAQLRYKAKTDALAPEERKEKTKIMQRILRTDAEIRNLAEPWLNDLSQLIDRNQPQPMH